jgi:thiosulfate dehydrogenase (quinone) large subunit
MSRLEQRGPLGDDPESEPTSMPRSTFLSWIGLGLASVAGGASALLDGALSSVPALASVKPMLSIGSGMPVVSTTGLFLGSTKTLQPNQSLAYTDPKSGDPAILIRLPNGQLVSYDMVCPHRGCTVPYNPAQRLLVCPCHGAQFDPARGAVPLSGPVSQPLINLPIRVDGAGNVYALDARPGTKVNRLRAAPSPSSGGDDGAGDDAPTGRHKRKTSGGD